MEKFPEPNSLDSMEGVTRQDMPVAFDAGEKIDIPITRSEISTESKEAGRQEALQKVRQDLGVESDENGRERGRQEENLEQERRLKESVANLAQPLGKLARVLRQRADDGLDEIIDSAGVSYINATAGLFYEFPNRKELNVADAEEINTAIAGMIKALDRSGNNFGSRTMRENTDSLGMLGSLTRDASESGKQLLVAISKTENHLFEDTSPLLSGLLSKLEIFGDEARRRYVATERYLSNRY